MCLFVTIVATTAPPFWGIPSGFTCFVHGVAESAFATQYYTTISIGMGWESVNCASNHVCYGLAVVGLVDQSIVKNTAVGVGLFFR